jgi:hypothetical protein
MPFTPFHMGPGAAVKAVAGRYFSLTVFGFAQVAMDIEPLLRIVRGDAMLHGFTHTYAGATAIAFAAFFLGRPCCSWLLKTWNLAAENNLLYAVSDGWLHLFCLILGVTGAMALLVIFIWNKIAIET